VEPEGPERSRRRAPRARRARARRETRSGAPPPAASRTRRADSRSTRCPRSSCKVTASSPASRQGRSPSPCMTSRSAPSPGRRSRSSKTCSMRPEPTRWRSSARPRSHPGEAAAGNGRRPHGIARPRGVPIALDAREALRELPARRADPRRQRQRAVPPERAQPGRTDASRPSAGAVGRHRLPDDLDVAAGAGPPGRLRRGATVATPRGRAARESRRRRKKQHSRDPHRMTKRRRVPGRSLQPGLQGRVTWRALLR
jgi:hypothetical protein